MMCGDRSWKNKNTDFYCVHMQTLPNNAISDLHDFKY